MDNKIPRFCSRCNLLANHPIVHLIRRPVPKHLVRPLTVVILYPFLHYLSQLPKPQSIPQIHTLPLQAPPVYITLGFPYLLRAFLAASTQNHFKHIFLISLNTLLWLTSIPSSFELCPHPPVAQCGILSVYLLYPLHELNILLCLSLTLSIPCSGSVP